VTSKLYAKPIFATVNEKLNSTFSQKGKKQVF